MFFKKELIEKKDTLIEKEDAKLTPRDLDREQNVDVSPVQLNSQNLHIHLDNQSNSTNYSSKITGVTYMEESKRILSNVCIYLFWGHEWKNPICKTYSDKNGNFVIDEIPPGYYTLSAKLAENLKFQAEHFIKVLPCQQVNESIYLKPLEY